MLTCADPPLELCWPAPAEEGRPAARGRIRVEEDRKPELRSDPVGDSERTGSRSLAVGGIQRDDRHDIRRTDPRVGAHVAAKGNSLMRARDACAQRVDELLLAPDEREDRAVVVLIRMHIEE